jgi:hypothetical protein
MARRHDTIAKFAALFVIPVNENRGGHQITPSQTGTPEGALVCDGAEIVPDGQVHLARI